MMKKTKTMRSVAAPAPVKREVLEGQLLFFDIGIGGTVLPLPALAQATPDAVSNSEIERIIKKNMPLVESWLKKTAGVSSENEEDVRQAGLVALWRAAETFRPDKGANFGTYASTCIRRAIYKEVKKDNKRSNQTSLDLLLNEGSGSAALSVNESDAFADGGSSVIKLMMRTAETLQSVRERKGVLALAMYLQGYSKAEIAKAQNIKESSCTAMISVGRKVLQRHPVFLENTRYFNEGRCKEYTVDLLGTPFKLKFAHDPVFYFPIQGQERLEENLCKALAQEDVADYLLNEVRIGEQVCIFNEKERYTTVINVYEDTLEITFAVKATDSSRKKKSLDTVQEAS